MKAHMTTLNGAAFGQHNGNSRLTFGAVEDIRRLRMEQGLTYKVLGRMFGVHQTTARLVVIGKTWQHSTGEIVFRATTEDADRIRTMIANKCGIRKIASTLGVTEGSIRGLMASQDISSSNPPAISGRKARCKHGHDLTGENRYVSPQGIAHCKECARRLSREYARKRRALAKQED